MSRDLANLYRPDTFDEVYGHDAIVKAFKKYEEDNNWAHCYMLTGGAGMGKTTFGRLIAKGLGCDAGQILEVDGARYSKVEEARELVQSLKYKSFGKPEKVVIIDECHRLSSNAWDVFLKITEDTPEYLYFVFCTSEPQKIPKAMKTRGVKYDFKPVKNNDLEELIEDICDAEEIGLPEGACRVIARKAEGSPREAINSLEAVLSCETLSEVKEILASDGEDTEIILLARLLCFGNANGEKFNWKTVKKILSDNSHMEPEGIRLMIVNYTAKCLLGDKTDEDSACRMISVLEAFSEPCNSSEKMAPILLSIGTILFN